MEDPELPCHASIAGARFAKEREAAMLAFADSILDRICLGFLRDGAPVIVRPGIRREEFTEMDDETARAIRRGMYMWGEEIAEEISEEVNDPDAPKWTPGEPVNLWIYHDDLRKELTGDRSSRQPDA